MLNPKPENLKSLEGSEGGGLFSNPQGVASGCFFFVVGLVLSWPMGGVASATCPIAS